LASFPHALRSAPGPNRTLEACRSQIELAAVRHGPAMVEAASLGPERRARGGLYEGLVEVRIVYGLPSYYEVRQATLKCTARPDGSIVGIEVLPAADGGASPL